MTNKPSKIDEIKKSLEGLRRTRSERSTSINNEDELPRIDGDKLLDLLLDKAAIYLWDELDSNEVAEDALKRALGKVLFVPAYNGSSEITIKSVPAGKGGKNNLAEDDEIGIETRVNLSVVPPSDAEDKARITAKLMDILYKNKFKSNEKDMFDWLETKGFPLHDLSNKIKKNGGYGG